MTLDFPLEGEGPFYTEYLKDIQDSTSPVWDEDAGTVVYVSNSSFGLASLTWPASGGVFDHKADIIARFNEVYAYREIGSETRSRWLHQLQVTFNGLIAPYDHRFAVYAANAAHLTDLDEKVTTTSDVTNNDFDTPSTNVAGIADGYLTRQAQQSGTVTLQDPKGTVIEAASRNMDEYRDLIEEFVEEFRDNFISLYRP